MKRFFVVILFASISQVALASNEEPSYLAAGAGQWTSDLTGNLGDFNTDLNELGFTDSSNTYFHLEIEHSTPLLPNVQLESTSISASGTGTLTASYQIGTQTFAISTSVKSDLDLSLTDLVLYYKPLKHLEINIADLDVGIVLRKFDADAAVTSQNLTPNVSDSESADGVVPLGYLRANINLPISGSYLVAESKFVSYDEQSINDTRVAIGYAVTPFSQNETSFGIEAGQRTLEIDLGTDEEFAGDVELSGAYIGLKIAGSF